MERSPRAFKRLVNDFVVVIAAAAEGDIRDAFVWCRERNALAADAYRAEVFDTIERIADAPLSRPSREDGLRKSILQRFPYCVFDEVLENIVTILAVAHHRRRPGYWRSRKR